MLVINNNTTKLLTTNTTTQNNRSIAILRHGPHPTHGIVVANGKQYGIAGGYAMRRFVTRIPRGKHFLCDTLATFAPRSVVTLLRRRNIPLGARQNSQMFPISSGTISIISNLIHCTGRNNIHFTRNHTATLYLRSNHYANIALRSNHTLATSTIVITANNTSCPNANSANSNCTLTGRTKRAIIRPHPSLMTLRSRSIFYLRVRKLSLGGYNLRIQSGRGGGVVCASLKRVLFARFNIDNPVILSTDTRVHRVTTKHCALCVS